MKPAEMIRQPIQRAIGGSVQYAIVAGAFGRAVWADLGCAAGIAALGGLATGVIWASFPVFASDKRLRQVVKAVTSFSIALGYSLCWDIGQPVGGLMVWVSCGFAISALLSLLGGWEILVDGLAVGALVVTSAVLLVLRGSNAVLVTSVAAVLIAVVAWMSLERLRRLDPPKA